MRENEKKIRKNELKTGYNITKKVLFEIKK